MDRVTFDLPRRPTGERTGGRESDGKTDGAPERRRDGLGRQRRRSLVAPARLGRRTTAIRQR